MVQVYSRVYIFQSTRPVWGATPMLFRKYKDFNISIHAPRVGRDGCGGCNYYPYPISIHAPRVGRDWAGVSNTVRRNEISIHAPRVGRDFHSTKCAPQNNNFNPRAPCGARRWLSQNYEDTDRFQSTRPVWGATLHNG